MKVCSKCKMEKSPSEFYKDKTRKDGLYPQCRKCASEAKRKVRETPEYKAWFNEYRKKWREENSDKERATRNRTDLKRKYGITPERYEELVVAQNGRCAICGEADGESAYRLGVDHCHTTGRVRALLCSKCNTGLGQFRDSTELLHLAIRYLKEHTNE